MVNIHRARPARFPEKFASQMLTRSHGSFVPHLLGPSLKFILHYAVVPRALSIVAVILTTDRAFQETRGGSQRGNQRGLGGNQEVCHKSHRDQGSQKRGHHPLHPCIFPPSLIGLPPQSPISLANAMASLLLQQQDKAWRGSLNVLRTMHNKP